MLAQKEYTYTYEEGKLVRAAECDITLDASGFTVSRTLINTVFYIYGEEDTLGYYLFDHSKVINVNNNEKWYRMVVFNFLWSLY